MKKLFFFIALAGLFFASCDDVEMVTEVTKDTPTPNWLRNYQCDSTDLTYNVESEQAIWIFDQDCNLTHQVQKLTNPIGDFIAGIFIRVLFTLMIIAIFSGFID